MKSTSAKVVGQKSKSPKNILSKSVNAGKIMEQATKLNQSGKLNAMKKLYGNDRGSFLHKQATKPQGDNHPSIGYPLKSR